tara:strand:- start:2285 stop:3589 length:1305 start_codon:yes stop_codon:yes gene_type:complete
MNRIFNFNQKFFIRIPIFISVLFLILISLSILKYAGNFESDFLGVTLSRLQKQMIWIFLGSFTFLIVQFVRIRFLNEKMFLLYGLFIILISLPFFSEATKGAQNWFLGFQPSEIGKLIVVIALAKILSDYKKYINNIFFLLLSVLIILVPVSIFVLQKDLGTALVYSFMFIPMVYWAGIKPAFIFLILSPIFTVYTVLSFNIYDAYSINSLWPDILLISLILFSFFFLLKIFVDKKSTFIFKTIFILLYLILNLSFSVISDFSWSKLEFSESRRAVDLRGRIENFVIPSLNPNAGGWQIKQSMVAVGSGGLFGVGLGEGTQVKLQFLPEADTDFIISSIAEALGFLFIFAIILLYILLFYWLLVYAQRASTDFSSLIIIGYASILFAHSIITLGMAVALAPVTGIPAPFLSYGGTFTISCFSMLGICNNISNNG